MSDIKNARGGEMKCGREREREGGGREEEDMAADVKGARVDEGGEEAESEEAN